VVKRKDYASSAISMSLKEAEYVQAQDPTGALRVGEVRGLAGGDLRALQHRWVGLCGEVKRLRQQCHQHEFERGRVSARPHWRTVRGGGEGARGRGPARAAAQVGFVW